MPQNFSRPHFLYLDFLRGVAAFAVVLLHWFEGNGYNVFRHALLAVDFFFMLSGFVICYSYEDRLRKGLGLIQFMKLRIIRLYPLILMGATLGVARALGRYAIEGAETGGFQGIIALYALNLLMVPANIFDAAQSFMFPLNIALWSLFFEFIAYAFFGLFAYKWRITPYLIIAAISAVIIWPWIFTTSQTAIDAGPLPNNYALNGIVSNELAIGFFRMTLAFSLGILAFKLRKALNVSFILAPIIGVFMFVYFTLPAATVPAEIDMLIYLTVFPTILIVGSNIDVRQNHFVHRMSSFSGDLSYPLYVLHTPLIWILGWIAKKASIYIAIPHILHGLWIIPVTVMISYVALKLYDEPTRSRLKPAA
jgi:peptidoglycan/LPS O-acetylase OafA/YrhL